MPPVVSRDEISHWTRWFFQNESQGYTFSVVDCKTFTLIAALADRMSSMDGIVRGNIRKLDLKTISKTLLKAKVGVTLVFRQVQVAHALMFAQDMFYNHYESTASGTVRYILCNRSKHDAY